MRTHISLSIILFTLTILSASLLFGADYEFTPVPQWVAPLQATQQDSTPREDHSGGVAYLLTDYQIKVEKNGQEKFCHYSEKALNPTGVQEISQITIDFDPLYESIMLHSLKIHRKGTVLDKIDTARLSILQREEDLDYQIYDGSKTLSILVEDVRVGDSIEYSYTIKGANPVFEGHFAKSLRFGWSVPVSRCHYRLLWPSSRPLFIKSHVFKKEPNIVRRAGITEYVWLEENTEALNKDTATPDWYMPYPTVYLSDYKSWSDVVAWALPMYKNIINSPSLQSVIKNITESCQSDEERILAAFRFVQDDIRYLGLEMGENSHRPNAPEIVIERRFGDCKDKARLLASLLNGMNIETQAALVHSYSGRHILNRLPTPLAFNHVITLVRHAGKNYWLDPARNYQAGKLDHIYQPDYEYALVIDEKSKALTHMTLDLTALHSKRVEETFDISDPQIPTTYRIQTWMTNYYADDMRKSLSESNLKTIQQSYLNYTAKVYPGSQLLEEMRIDDNEKQNVISIKEGYAIPEIWIGDDQESYVNANFEPFLLLDHIKKVSSPIRTMPYSISHPVQYKQSTKIIVPQNSLFENETFTIDNKAFLFTQNISYENNILNIDYSYESRSDHVAPEDIDTYSKDINQLLSLAGYQIQLPNPKVESTSQLPPKDDINWLMIAAAFITIIGSILLLLKLIYLYDPLPGPGEQVDSQLEGLGGWLIIPGLGLVFTPLRILFQSRDFLNIFSVTEWGLLGNQLGYRVQALICCEFLVNSLLFIAAFYLLVLYFKRRHTFPKLYIIFLLSALIVTIGDEIVATMVIPEGFRQDEADTGGLARQLIYTVIWTSYFIKSKRVKATFTETRRKEITEE
ncbi:DUF3857 domain-containing protein [Desulfogranum japonicum]|uniref:DUF3857 domain-containing protein n=1 Tax=Desulfogranum japonicum TaxID=231447 RepID=UPI000428DB6B|nr:DUF3857 domain-containing protein [Desulfogranum japonicum]